MTVVPPRIHSFNRRAVSRRKSCMGPWPSDSATWSLSASFRPMNEKFSGRQAISAPELLGLAQQRSGGCKIVGDDVARGHLYSGYSSHLLRCLCGLLRCLCGRGSVRALDAFDGRIIPAAGDPIIPPCQPLQRLFEHLCEHQHCGADHRAAGECRQRQRAARRSRSPPQFGRNPCFSSPPGRSIRSRQRAP